MPRQRRLVVPGYVHHLTQRGVRRQRTFFGRRDYLHYLDLVREWCPRYGIEVLTHSLMPNHVHLAAVPASEDSLAQGMKQVNQRYTRAINAREDWSGSLWQGRFWSAPFDWADVPTLVQYILMNPVRAKLAPSAIEWPYSSARAVILGEPDGIVNVSRLAEVLDGRGVDVAEDVPADVSAAIARSTRGGYPVGSESFVDSLEKQLGRSLRPKPAGRRWLEKLIGVCPRPL
jgi:putative transposase